jgi:hypothetical protein
LGGAAHDGCNREPASALSQHSLYISALPGAFSHSHFVVSHSQLSLTRALCLSHSPTRLSHFLLLLISRFSLCFSRNCPSPASLYFSLCLSTSLWFSLRFSMINPSLCLSAPTTQLLCPECCTIFSLSLSTSSLGMPRFLSRYSIVFSFEIQRQSVKARLPQKSSSRHTTPYLLDESYSV